MMNIYNEDKLTELKGKLPKIKIFRDASFKELYGMVDKDSKEFLSTNNLHSVDIRNTNFCIIMRNGNLVDICTRKEKEVYKNIPEIINLRDNLITSIVDVMGIDSEESSVIYFYLKVLLSRAMKDDVGPEHVLKGSKGKYIILTNLVSKSGSKLYLEYTTSEFKNTKGMQVKCCNNVRLIEGILYQVPKSYIKQLRTLEPLRFMQEIQNNETEDVMVIRDITTSKHLLNRRSQMNEKLRDLEDRKVLDYIFSETEKNIHNSNIVPVYYPKAKRLQYLSFLKKGDCYLVLARINEGVYKPYTILTKGVGELNIATALVDYGTYKFKKKGET